MDVAVGLRSRGDDLPVDAQGNGWGFNFSEAVEVAGNRMALRPGGNAQIQTEGTGSFWGDGQRDLAGPWEICLLPDGHVAAAIHLDLEGEPQILIGTHALLFDKELFSDLGLIVIDEQHKFGVMQRGRLIEQGTTPDVLVMTATPIPRTLTMTIYGDLDVSILDERPAGRGKMVTAVRVKPKQTDLTRFVKDQLEAGRQAYLVFPLVEESGSLKVESATEAEGKWRKRLSKYTVGLLHGKLPPEEKEDIMRRFRDHEIDVLVATSVIEVGVDVPNANLMVIHHAERFGLAQLHQLRGRIGRGVQSVECDTEAQVASARRALRQ